MEEHDAGFDQSAALSAQRNILRVHRVLRHRSGEALPTVDAGTLKAGAVALDQQGRREARLALKPVDVLREDATQQTLLGEELEEEVTGRGVVLVVGVEHLLGEDPERHGVVFEVVVVEDARWIAKVGDGVLVEIAVQAVRGAEVRDAGG